MSSSRRRRVMVDSDNEGSNDERENLGPPQVTPPTDPPTRRRMTVSVLDDQSGVADLENLLEHEECSAGAEEEDEVERKRRKQLAQRWSNLASDSDHGHSSDEDEGNEGRIRGNSSLVQMSVRDAWRRSTPSRAASRYLVREPVSGDDDEDRVDDMAGFIVDSQDEECSDTPSRRKRRGRKSKHRKGASREPAVKSTPPSRSRRCKAAASRRTAELANSKTKKRRIGASSSEENSEEDNDGEREERLTRRKRAKQSGKPPSESESSSAAAAKNSASASPVLSGSYDDAENSPCMETPARRRTRGRPRRASVDTSEEEANNATGALEKASTRRSKPRNGAKKSSKKAVVDLASDEDDGHSDADDSEGDEDGKPSVEVTPAAGSGTRGARTRSQARPSKAQRETVSKECETSGKGSSSSKKSRRSSSGLNYRAVLMDCSSEDENGDEEGNDSDGSFVEDEEDATDDSSSSAEGEGKTKTGKKLRCARDSDADSDDGFAQNLDSDDEDEDDEAPWWKSKNTTRRSRRSTRRSKNKRGFEGEASPGSRPGQREHSGEQDESEVSDDSDLVDDDDDRDEGDVFFSHAAFFNQQEHQRELGASCFSLETMTLNEAFLFYMEYLAKAAAGNGVGPAFMKKFVSQPMLPEHIKYSKAKDIVEKKICVTRESLCGTWRQEFRDSILRYPHYGYQHVDMMEIDAHCHACNRSNRTKVVAFLAGAAYDPNRVWDGLRWDRHLPKDWDNPDKMAESKQEARATHHLGDTCKHKSHLYHSLVHYKLYLVSKIAAKIRSDSTLKPENFRGEGRGNKKKIKRCLNFTENEFEALTALLDKADELNGVKWGAKVGLRGGHGRTFLQAGAGASILQWLSGEARPGQYGELDLFRTGGSRNVGHGQQSGTEHEEEEEEAEAEFSVGRGRQWQTVGSRGGRYD